MAEIHVAFNEQNVRFGGSRWIFSRVRLMRFEWLALLALKRFDEAADQGWVSIEEISRLPNWSGRSHHHVVTNVGRYLQAFEHQGINIVRAETRWAGPYRLDVKRDNITFDLPVIEAERRLGLWHWPAISTRETLLRFTPHYARAQWLLSQGRLATAGPRLQFQEGAYRRLVGLVEDGRYGPRLRAIAWLAAVQVLFQLGRFDRARRTLGEYRRLLRRARDNALTAQYFLALAWSHQRAASGRSADRETLAALRSASAYSERATDREVAGILAYRRSGYLTKHGQHAEAVAELLRALEAHLVIGNFQNVQAVCVDIGSDLHRLGAGYYQEARRWILAGLTICRWMNLGKDNSHGEAILGKMYVEEGRRFAGRLWLTRALRIAAQANNAVSLADAHMVMALWNQQFGREIDTIESIMQALTIFRRLKHFDCAQKEAYMARKFPEVWRLAVSKVSRDDQLFTGSAHRIKPGKSPRNAA